MNPSLWTRACASACNRNSFAGLALISALSAQANTLFKDTEFNYADYGVTTVASPGVSPQLGQSLTGGNSGAFLSANTLVPAGSDTFISAGYITNRVYNYDPSASGQVASITYSMDDLINLQSPNLNSNFLIYQGGNYFVHQQSVGAVQPNTWVHTGPVTLGASNFSLVTDLAHLTVDAAQHPDFATGSMLFGTYYYLKGTESADVINISRGFDNFSVSVSAVPENGTLTLFLLGLLPALGFSRLRRLQG